MFCTQCGHRNVDVARFCAACGRALFTSGRDNVSPEIGVNTVAVAIKPQVQLLGRAGFWNRSAAVCLDTLIVMGISLLAGALSFGLGLAFQSEVSAEIAVAGYYLAAVLCSWLYFALGESSVRQATFGKRAVGLIVTDTLKQFS